MSIEEVYRELALGEPEEGFARGWEDSQRTLPSLPLPFLTESFIRENAPRASLAEGVIERLCKAGARYARSEPVNRLLWHEHRIYTGTGTPGMETTTRLRKRRRQDKRFIAFLDQEYDPSGFPDLFPLIGKDAAILNLLIALSALPNTLWFYRNRRIPDTVLSATLSDFAVWNSYYDRFLGYEGINLGTLSWLRFHLQGRLFRLGRLQFMQGGFPRDLTVYRSVRTGEVRALAAAGLPVKEEGLLVYEEPAAAIWTTVRRCTADTIIGNPIEATGRIRREPLALAIEEYRPLLEENSPVLEIHIPEGGPMSPETCEDSINRAAEFFPAFFPERAFIAFTCESWFLGRDLLDLLPESSNMVRFARELHLYPAFGGHEEILARIFGPRYKDLRQADWARESRLQRSVADYVAAGGILREGGGFLLREELPWGQGYR